MSTLYFFTIRDLDTRVTDDPQGIDLPSAADALFYAEHKIGDLRHESGYDNPRLIMIVQDEQHHSLWSLPFLPACAELSRMPGRRSAAKLLTKDEARRIAS